MTIAAIVTVDGFHVELRVLVGIYVRIISICQSFA